MLRRDEIAKLQALDAKCKQQSKPGLALPTRINLAPKQVTAALRAANTQLSIGATVRNVVDGKRAAKLFDTIK